MGISRFVRRGRSTGSSPKCCQSLSRPTSCSRWSLFSRIGENTDGCCCNGGGAQVEYSPEVIVRKGHFLPVAQVSHVGNSDLS